MAGSDYAELARQAAGNWRKFESFAWHCRPEDAEKWCIVYTHNRDSELLEQSNADAIAEQLKPHLEADDPDIIEEHHDHWACGWIDGYAIRVFDDRGEPTEAFKAWCDIQESLENYPVLDEEDLSRREYEDTIENIEGELHRANRDDEYRLPEDAAEQVYSWLSDHDPGAVDPRDGGGGYPSCEEIQAAFDALGWRIIWVVRYIDCGETVEQYEHEWEARDRCEMLKSLGYFPTYDEELPELEEA